MYPFLSFLKNPQAKVGIYTKVCTPLAFLHSMYVQIM